MIEFGHRKKYNVGGIFLSNQDDTNDNQEIAMLNWDERFYFENPINHEEEGWRRQIDDLAREFSDMVVARAYLQ